MLKQTEITEQHKILFKIKYLDHVINQFDLMKALNLPQNIFERLDRELDEYLFEKLGKVTSDRLRFVCQNCLSTRAIEDIEAGETVCTDCGYVNKDVEVAEDQSLPFDTPFSPSSDLAVGRSLGTPITYRDQKKMQKDAGDNYVLFKEFRKLHPKIAAKLKHGEVYYDDKTANAYLLESPHAATSTKFVSEQISEAFAGVPYLHNAEDEEESEKNKEHGGKVYICSFRDVATYALANLFDNETTQKLFHMTDLPLRVRRLRIICSQENPEIDKLLQEAFALSKNYGLSNDYTFNNNLGRNVRRAFWLAHDLKIKVHKQSLVTCVFYFTICCQQGATQGVTGKNLKVALDAKSTLLRDEFLFNLLVKFYGFLSEAKRSADMEYKEIDADEAKRLRVEHLTDLVR